MKNKLDKNIELRHEIHEANKKRTCPIRNNNCETLNCMWYDEEEQECCMMRISQALNSLDRFGITVYDD